MKILVNIGTAHSPRRCKYLFDTKSLQSAKLASRTGWFSGLALRQGRADNCERNNFAMQMTLRIGQQKWYLSSQSCYLYVYLHAKAHVSSACAHESRRHAGKAHNTGADALFGCIYKARPHIHTHSYTEYLIALCHVACALESFVQASHQVCIQMCALVYPVC
jgi:hypothetical protein